MELGICKLVSDLVSARLGPETKFCFLLRSGLKHFPVGLASCFFRKLNYTFTYLLFCSASGSANRSFLFTTSIKIFYQSRGSDFKNLNFSRTFIDFSICELGSTIYINLIR
jgi:hypothetical protein